MTTINVTHDQREALVMSDSVIVMNGGGSARRRRPWRPTRALPSASLPASSASPISCMANCVAHRRRYGPRCVSGEVELAGRHADPGLRAVPPLELAVRAERFGCVAQGDASDARFEALVTEVVFEGDRLVYEVGRRRCGAGFGCSTATAGPCARPRPGGMVTIGWLEHDLVVFRGKTNGGTQNDGRTDAACPGVGCSRGTAAGSGVVAAPWLGTGRRGPGQAGRADRARLGRGVGRSRWRRACPSRSPRPTGIAVRHDLTEDNEIRPKIWAAVDQGRVPSDPRQLGHPTNAIKSALRGVTEDLADLPVWGTCCRPPRPGRLPGRAGRQHVLLCLRPGVSRGGLFGRERRKWQVLFDPKHKGRIALYDDGIGFHFVAQKLGGGKVEDIPANMEPAGSPRQAQGAGPLLGEDPDFTTWFQNGEIDLACTILTTRGRRRQNGIEVAWTCPPRAARSTPTGCGSPRACPRTSCTGQGVRELCPEPAGPAGLDRRPGPARAAPRPHPARRSLGDPAYPTTPADFAS